MGVKCLLMVWTFFCSFQHASWHLRVVEVTAFEKWPKTIHGVPSDTAKTDSRKDPSSSYASIRAGRCPAERKCLPSASVPVHVTKTLREQTSCSPPAVHCAASSTQAGEARDPVSTTCAGEVVELNAACRQSPMSDGLSPQLAQPPSQTTP